MSWWPFRCKEQSSPEDDPDEVITITATPYAGRVSEMLAAGWPGDQIVAVLLLQESVDSHSTLATDILSELGDEWSLLEGDGRLIGGAGADVLYGNLDWLGYVDLIGRLLGPIGADIIQRK